jgi:hypothetical protein
MNKIFYQCFSENQKRFLVSKGHRILLKAIHIDTKKIFWCFLICEELELHLKEWSKK